MSNGTVIVFQEDCILVAIGREGAYPGLSKVKRIPLSGTGDTFDRWEQALTELAPIWKAEQARLVLPASMSSTRVLPIPYGKGKQLQEMAAREVENSFRNEISDYSLVYQDKKNGIDLCAGGADQGVLEHFLEICQKAGVSPRSMTVPMEGYLNLLKQMEGYEDQTAIYLFFEEGSMTSIICQNGRYLYSSRSRLFSEPGTLDFGTEIVRSISGILQFSAGNRRELRITQVYYAGCPPEDFEVSIQGIEELHLRVYPLKGNRRMSLPAGENPLDWLPCIGALILGGKKEKRIDLYKAVLANQERGESSTHIWKHLLVPGILFGAGLIVTGVLMGVRWNQNRETQKIQDWMESPEVQAQYQEALELQNQLSEIEGGISAVEQMEQNLSVYPELSSEIIHRIENVGGGGMQLKVMGYDVETGVLTFEASSREVIDVPSYILHMQETGIFHKVDYTGYTYENEWYTLSLSCTMEGKEIAGGGK
ncbi:MAG: hypothetical protein HFJ10_05695 [Lachnospiraceae bacterium]|jgi:hypothetical protein|nr:hypothetical protein [Lachnospiraceae bacterium]